MALIIYVSIGIFLLAEAIVIVWQRSEEPKILKALACVFSILIWPVMFFL